MKFATLDERYLTQRRRVSEQIGERELWSVIDHWPLYVGIGNLGRFMAISDILRETLDVPGHIAEFGSWRGANLMFMAKLLRIYDPHGSKQVHCFESFVGLETFSGQDGSSGGSEAGTYRGNYDELMAMIDLGELGDDIAIHRGDILKTLPDVLGNEGLSFSLVYCDTDLYAPSKLILDHLHPRLSKGGAFVMDEWNYDKWPGEALAVREFMGVHGDAYDMIQVRNARQPSLVLKKVR
jgi:hypothetical protein